MAKETFGTALARLCDEQHIQPSILAERMDWKGPGSFYRFVSEERIPRQTTIDKLMQALELNYEDRIYLYGLAGYLPPLIEPTQEEKERNVGRLGVYIKKSSIPTLILDYKYKIWSANSAIARMTSIQDTDISDLIRDEVSLLEIVFNRKLGFQPKIKDWMETATDVIRDFVSFNILRRHESFFQEYPECLDHCEGFREIWKKAQYNPYFNRLENRGLGQTHKPIIFENSEAIGGKLTFYISRPPIPILGNLFLFFRFAPYDTATTSFFKVAPFPY